MQLVSENKEEKRGPTELAAHRIRSVEIVGGFLDGSQFDFADGLNCFIGARGTE